MTRSVTTLSLALLLAISAGCQSLSPDNEGPDAGIGVDGARPDGPDAAQLQCSHVRVLPKYPWGVTAGTYLPQEKVTFGIVADSTSTAASRLSVEVWPPGGAEPSLPFVRTFSPADHYKTCESCVLMGEGCTTSPNTCKTYYFAQGGQLQVNEAGRTEASGRLKATGSHIVLAEWSMTNDAPVANGRCVEISNFKIDAEWGSGGACSGDSCGAGCCADSPYCTLGNNNIGRYCSDFCGESGDGCTGPNDCCDGFSCFLGTCIVESCGGDSCSQGLDAGGGCCGQNPYCVDDRCTSTCGGAGAGCGATLDCCSGLSCSGGTCN
jgi:hypothetical protein